MRLLNIFGKKKRTLWEELNENPLVRQQKELYDLLSLQCGDGIDADELPSGHGEFGMSASNPIPCHTIFGSTVYLGRLRTSDGIKVKHDRRGSVSSTVSRHPVDAYAIHHPNGQELGTIYISPYQKRISGKAPKGFMLAA